MNDWFVKDRNISPQTSTAESINYRIKNNDYDEWKLYYFCNSRLSFIEFSLIENIIFIFNWYFEDICNKKYIYFFLILSNNLA